MRWFFQQDLDIINRFLKALGPSLEVFRCDSKGMFTPCAPIVEQFYISPPLEHCSIDLTYNIHLRCLEFPFNGFHNDVLFAMSTLSRIGSQQLEQIAFHLNSPRWIYGDFPIAEWTKMDAILASPQFATLKDLRIFALTGTFTDPSNFFATLLPTCHARGVISFTDLPSW
jgi:hypothetical protein